MDILVTGSKGQLGTELQLLAPAFDIRIFPFDVVDLDITDSSAVNRVLSDRRFDLVMNAAAYNAVDKAETEPEMAYKINRDGPANLSLACAKQEIPFFHVSTDYVFSGEKTTPYLESDPTEPLGVYAKSKEAGERAAVQNNPRTLVFRTAWLYSRHGSNFVKTILRLAREREELKIVSDQFGCPTCARDLGRTLLTVARHWAAKHEEPWGIYHCAGGGSATWFEFAQAIVKEGAAFESFKVRQILPQLLAEYPSPTKRPRYTVLDCSGLETNWGISLRPWREALAETISELYGPQKG